MLEEVLNAFTKEIKSICYKLNAPLPKAQLLCGNVGDLLAETIKGVAPYSKVAYVAGKEEYLLNAKSVFSAVTEAGSSFIGLVGDCLDCIDDISWLFNLPDDVRAVVISEENFIAPIAYYASIKKIKPIIICEKAYFEGLYTQSAVIKVGDKLDRVRYDVDRIVLFSNTASWGNAFDENVLRFLIKNITAITDFLIFNPSYDKMCSLGLKFIKKATDRVYNAIIEDDNLSNALFLKAQILADYGNYLTGGKVFELSRFSKSISLQKLTGCDSVMPYPSTFGKVYLRFIKERLSDKNVSEYIGFLSELNEFCERANVNYNQTLIRLLEYEKNYLNYERRIRKQAEDITESIRKLEKILSSKISDCVDDIEQENRINKLLQWAVFLP